jgi:hypothetical protein
MDAILGQCIVTIGAHINRIDPGTFNKIASKVETHVAKGGSWNNVDDVDITDIFK